MEESDAEQFSPTPKDWACMFEGRLFSKEFVRFVVVGTVSTVLNYLLFVVLFKFVGIHYVVSSIAGYIAGHIFGYNLNRAWTFSSVIASRVKEYSFYALLNLFSLVLNIATLHVLVTVFSLNPLVANVFAIGTSTISNFLGCKCFVFNKAAIGCVKKIIGPFR